MFQATSVYLVELVVNMNQPMVSKKILKICLAVRKTYNPPLEYFYEKTSNDLT